MESVQRLDQPQRALFTVSAGGALYEGSLFKLMSLAKGLKDRYIRSLASGPVTVAENQLALQNFLCSDLRFMHAVPDSNSFI